MTRHQPQEVHELEHRHIVNQRRRNLQSAQTLDQCLSNFLVRCYLFLSTHACTASPACLAPKYIASTYLGSQTTAPPNVNVFSSPIFSSSHCLPMGETGRIRKTDPWFSKTRSS